MSTLILRKQRLRDIATERRRRLAAAHDIGAQLAAQFDRCLEPLGAIVSGYWPIGDEANVMPLLMSLGTRGYKMALPVVPGRGQPLVFREWKEGDSMAKGPFGISEPMDKAKIVLPDTVLAPLLAFDRAGRRLGYGGGFYDRSIAALRQGKPVLVVGIAFAGQEFDGIPCDESDIPVDWIVTETEAIKAEQTRP